MPHSPNRFQAPDPRSARRPYPSRRYARWTARLLPMGLLLALAVGLLNSHEPRAEAAGHRVGPVPQSAQSVVLQPSDDSFTNRNSPNTNYGNSTELKVDASPAKIVWLKFVVSDATRPILRARVRLYVIGGSSQGGDLYRVSDNNWSEGGLDWANQPTVDGATLASMGRVRSGNWYEWDVTTAVTGNGTYTFALKSGSNNGAEYRSLEAGDRRPELIIDLAGSTSTPALTGTPPSTSTPTTVASSTPISTSTPQATASPTPTNPAQPQATATSTPSAGTVLWSADHETGDFSQWTQGWCGGTADSGTGDTSISTDLAHGGRYALKLSIENASGTRQGARMGRWKCNPSEGYYSAWYYIPVHVTTDQWWNVFHFKSMDPNSVSRPMWDLNVGNLPNGAMYFYLVDKSNGSPREIHQPQVNPGVLTVPVGRWFHIEAFYRRSTGASGRVTFYQDGVMIFDMNNVKTALSDNVQWVVNNYTDNITPSTLSIYVDDAKIATGRQGP